MTFCVDKAPIAMLENGKDEPFGGCLLACGAMPRTRKDADSPGRENPL
jgi:hypothetical protein